GDGQARKVEQAQRVAGRRRIDDDRVEAPFLELFADYREGVQLVDPRRRERKQVADDLAIVRNVDTATGQPREQFIDAIAVGVAEGHEGVRGVELLCRQISDDRLRIASDVECEGIADRR